MGNYIDFEKALASIKHQYEKLKSKCEALEQENALLRREKTDAEIIRDLMYKLPQFFQVDSRMCKLVIEKHSGMFAVRYTNSKHSITGEDLKELLIQTDEFLIKNDCYKWTQDEPVDLNKII